MSYDQRPQPGEYVPYYQKYVELVPDGDIIAILATQVDDTAAMLRELTDAQAGYAYAPGKWTIKQAVGHVMDAERIFAYRALRFARADATPLATFDENQYVPPGEFDGRPIASLLAEFAAVRRATLALLAGLPAAAWTRTGTASGVSINVRSLAWIIAGHEAHHRNIIAERYLPGATGAAPLDLQPLP